MGNRSIENKVQAILEKQLKKRGSRFSLKNTDSIIESGVLDSLSAVELVAELEKLFGIDVLPEEMSATNFDSILKITEFISLRIKND